MRDLGEVAKVVCRRLSWSLVTPKSSSQLAGLHQIEFQRLIASRGICVHYDIEDLEQDLKSLREESW